MMEDIEQTNHSDPFYAFESRVFILTSSMSIQSRRPSQSFIGKVIIGRNAIIELHFLDCPLSKPSDYLNLVHMMIFCPLKDRIEVSTCVEAVEVYHQSLRRVAVV